MCTTESSRGVGAFPNVARTRMQPHIEALRTDFARVLSDARDQRHRLLTVRVLARTFPDVVRHALRFVNWQQGSGTRMLVDHLLHEHSIDSDAADVGVGVEAAALKFGLRFTPLVEEDYFLACLKGNIAHAG